MPPENVKKLFWSKVERTDTCWLWTAATDRHGYGVFMPDTRRSGDRKIVRAHRFAFTLAGIELGDKHTHHVCKNRRCLRIDPQHVVPLTQADHLAIHPKPRDARGRYVG